MYVVEYFQKYVQYVVLYKIGDENIWYFIIQTACLNCKTLAQSPSLGILGIFVVHVVAAIFRNLEDFVCPPILYCTVSFWAINSGYVKYLWG